MREICKNPLAQKLTAGFVGIFVTMSSIALVIWLCDVFTNDEMTKKAEKLQLEVQCAKCATDFSENQCQECMPSSWPAMEKEPIASKCLKDLLYKRKLTSTIEDEMEKENRLLDKKMTERHSRTLGRSSRAQYQSPRVIMHWFPLGWHPEANSSWTAITEYERHRSTYTVSAGPNDSYSEHGHMVAAEMGLYVVYAKLTFSCTLDDQRMRHVSMEVLLIESSNYPPFVILKERQHASCNMKGDLTTLYQNGLIRMGEGNKLKLRYHVSDADNVQLSTGRHEAFKSCLGMYRVGLA